MSTLYIRLPSKAATGNAPHWPGLACPFALVSHRNLSHDVSIVSQGVKPLPDLSDTIAKAKRVVLLLAASDVTLLRVKLPQLSHARLKAALPNLVEDQLIGDTADCVFVSGDSSDGLRTIAVAQRAWLEALVKTLTILGARQIVALPSQLCLPCQPAQTSQMVNVAIAVNRFGNTIDMTLRLSDHDGIGLAISADHNESAAHEVIQTILAVVPEASIALFVQQSEIHAFQDVVNDSDAMNKRISVLADSWPRWISGANSTIIDLMAGMGAVAGPLLELRAWRWPLALAVAFLLVNVTALNIDWWRMKSEANSLRTTMTQIYKSAFPKDTVIINPAAQMRQKIAVLRHKAGLAAADDFMVIAAAFGEALASIAAVSGNTPAIAALEYRERNLFVRLRPNAELPMQQMKTALAERNLSLDQETSGSATIWKVGGMK